MVVVVVVVVVVVGRGELGVRVWSLLALVWFGVCGCERSCHVGLLLGMGFAFLWFAVGSSFCV